MEIKIRDVDAAHVRELDRKATAMAKRTGRKCSRNDYMKMLIERDVMLPLEIQKEDRFDRAIENLTATLDRQDESLSSLVEFLKERFG